MQRLHEDVVSQSMFTHKMDSPIVLFYHRTGRSLHPSLFLSAHLKMLTDKKTPASTVLSSLAWDTKSQLSSVSPTSVLSVNGFTPHSKKRRTAVSYSPLAIYDNGNSSNKPHIRKRHSWTHSNTVDIPQFYARAAPIKTIPTPGAHLIDEPDDICSEVQYVRDSAKYHREVRTEVERALKSAHVLYDMDSSDEEWFKSCNSDAFSEDTFEKMVDSFEKLAYTKKSDVLTALELEEVACKHEGCDFINDIYEYWCRKRHKIGLPLIRQFQVIFSIIHKFVFTGW
jgi:Enhancer of polycomb-like